MTKSVPGGSLSFHRPSKRWRLRVRLKRDGQVVQDDNYWFDTETEGERMKRFLANMPTGGEIGPTVREVGDLFLKAHDYSPSYKHTWEGLIARSCHFLDWPIVSVATDDGVEYAHRLLETRKVYVDRFGGIEKTITLPDLVSRSHANSALSLVRQLFNWAVNRRPVSFVKQNVLKDVKLPKPEEKKGGKLRTKKVKKTRARLDVMPLPDRERIFYCEHCAVTTGLPRNHLGMLERCEHFPFFYRVAMSVSIIQGLRQGEIASQRWERISVDGFADQHWESIRWAQDAGFSGMIWLVETSWDGETKNGQDRVQALVPMAAQLLHRWWQLKGSPQKGYLFTPGDVPRKIVSPVAGGGAQGPVRTLIAGHPDLSAADVVALLRDKGIYVTPLRVHQIRNDIRVKLGKKNQALHRLFARGYDFGWTDTVSNVRDATGNKTGEQKRRLGWRSKLGVAPLRYHDFRDTAASCLLSGEWGPPWRMEDVSDFLGHSSIKVTEARYASITNSAKVARAEHVRPGYWATDHSEPSATPSAAAINNKTPGLRDRQSVH